MNPNDVETVSVLKDPTLVGVYGDRGKNGVILIKTKSLSKNPRVKIVEIPAVCPIDPISLLEIRKKTKNRKNKYPNI